ncbi:MarR family winged helix-turn-helix transcriptional regulator [Mucilaginibacter sp. McL0603]|uniref:MarR family winged helix-turn-helix transcriptional regulator n=1 Tax=Mucilaginibacter sp. McL0603 TaxID=3415670 RepID=UPI003CF93EAB
MNFYENLGYLVFGSRLRRLSEGFLSEINKTYQAAGIEFDASWFPVFYLLLNNESLSIKELSDTIGVSHPAASQLVANLKSKKLIKTTTCADDGRRQLVQLTKAGHTLLDKILPVWEALSVTMEELVTAEPECQHLLPAITALENTFRTISLSEKITEKLATLKPAKHGQVL